METIGKLTGGIAHDFNNLLQVVSGNLQLLAKDVAGNDRAETRVTNALAGVERGAKLASQLLAFGRRQPLEPKVINVGRFVSGMEDLVCRSVGESVDCEIIVSDGLWNTSGRSDPGGDHPAQPRHQRPRCDERRRQADHRGRQCNPRRQLTPPPTTMSAAATM